MLIRVVIVLLAMLNLGAGVWWLLRPAPREAVVDPRVPGIALLEIVGDPVRGPPGPLPAASEPVARTAPLAPAAPVPPVVPPVAGPDAVLAQCASLGPFATPELARTAQAAIATPAVRVSLRTEAARGRGWRVLIPPAGDAAQATETATRIGAAGITDYFVMREGADANAIALGRYGGETAARRRAQSLIDAGFNARAEPVGTPAYWLDVVADAGVALADLRTRSGAARQQPRDCPPLTAAVPG